MSLGLFRKEKIAMPTSISELADRFDIAYSYLESDSVKILSETVASLMKILRTYKVRRGQELLAEATLAQKSLSEIQTEFSILKSEYRTKMPTTGVTERLENQVDDLRNRVSILVSQITFLHSSVLISTY